MKTRKTKFAPSLLLAGICAAAVALSSCAGHSNSVKPDDKISDEQLLEDSAKVTSTDVTDDSAAFADLETKNVAGTTEDSSGKPYYTSIGGESLKRVAFTLYGKRGLASKLLALNPDLRGVEKLSAGQKVYFDLAQLNPQTTYLTKDLLGRYASELSQAVEAKGLQKVSATIQAGESLQDVSKRLYGTSRYWAELYLANKDKIQDYDKVSAGLSLAAFEHSNQGIASAAAVVSPSSAVIVHEQQAEPTVQAAAPAPAAPAPVVIQQPAVATQSHPDPLSDTPPAPVQEQIKPVQASSDPGMLESNNVNSRRILYVLLILAIGGGAYYFTRGPKKRSNIDMLDINAEFMPRPKLPTNSDSKSHIG